MAKRAFPLLPALLTLFLSGAGAVAQSPSPADQGFMAEAYGVHRGTSAHRTLDGRVFTLERDGRRALFKFDDDFEVWSLRATNGPRGDEYFSNAAGRLVLKITYLGNIILYDGGNLLGAPVENLPDPAAIDGPVAEPGFAERLSAYASLRTGHPVGIEISGTSAHVLAYGHDAARIAVKGLIKAQDADQTSKAVARVKAIQVEPAKRSRFGIGSDGILKIGIDADAGYFGRPSSDEIMLYLKEHRSS